MAFIENHKIDVCEMAAPLCPATAETMTTSPEDTTATSMKSGGTGIAVGEQCNGHGTCLSDGSCSCFYTFKGETCNVTEWIDFAQPCGYKCTFDQGVCAVDSIFNNRLGSKRVWGCQCGAGYSGATCSLFTCPNGCNNNGHCIAQDTCSCYRGFLGASCAVDCGCAGHGQCGAGGNCICDQGWRRERSEEGCEWDCDTADTVGCAGPGQSKCAPGCGNGSCVKGICRCWAGFAGIKCNDPAAVPPPNHNVPVGLNLGGAGGVNWVFTDVIRGSARAWTSIPGKDSHAGQFAYQSGSQSLVWTNKQYVPSPRASPIKSNPAS